MGNTVTLHSACAYGDLSAVRALLKTATPAELEAKDDNGRTPLLVAVASMGFKTHDDDIDDDIFGDGFHDDDDESDDDDDEESAASHNDSAANGQQRDDSARSDRRRSKPGSAESEPEEVEEYNEHASIEPMSKQAEILHLLLQKHVNVDHQDENGWTALHHACFVQNPVAVKMLVHGGAHPMREKFGLLPQVRSELRKTRLLRLLRPQRLTHRGALSVSRTFSCAGSRPSGSRRRRT